jgi:hypothetical protein
VVAAAVQKAAPPPAPVEEVTDEQFEALLYMDESIPGDAKTEDLIANPRLGLHLRSGPPITGPFTPDLAKVFTQVPIFVGSLLIEALGVRFDPALKCRQVKSFSKPRVIGLRVPVQLPFTFQDFGPRRTSIGFFDTSRITAADMQVHVNLILSNLSSLGLLVAEAKNLDSRTFAPALVTFATDWGLTILYTVDNDNRETEVFDVTVRVLKSHWDDERDREVREELQALVKQSAVYHCETCKQLFSESDGPTCPRTRHRGKQVELYPGVMEEMAEDEEDEGEFITIVKYECCGEVAKDDPGCVKLAPTFHKPDPKKGTLPTLSFRDEAVSDYCK